MKVQQVILEKQQLNEVAPIVYGAVALAKVAVTTVVVGVAADKFVGAIADLIVHYQTKASKTNPKTLVKGMRITDKEGRVFAWGKGNDGKMAWFFEDKSRGGKTPFYPLKGVTDNPAIMADKLKWASGQADIDGNVVRKPTLDFSQVRNKVALFDASSATSTDSKTKKFLAGFENTDDVDEKMQKKAKAAAIRNARILGGLTLLIGGAGVYYNIRTTVETLRMQEGKIVNGKVYTKEQLNQDLSEIRGYTATLVTAVLLKMAVWKVLAIFVSVFKGKSGKVKKLIPVWKLFTRAAVGGVAFGLVFSKEYREWWANYIADIMIAQNIASAIDTGIESLLASFGYDYHKDVLSKAGLANKDQQRSSDVGSGKGTVKPEDLPAGNPNKNKTIDDLFNLNNY